MSIIQLDEGVRILEFEMTDKMTEVGTEVINKCDEYFNEFSKENGKKGFVWLTNEETGQLVIYTRGEYKDKILDFLATLK